MKRIVVLAVALLLGATLSTAQERPHQHSNRSDVNHEKAKREAGIELDSLATQSKWDGAHIAFVTTKHNFGEVQRKGGDLKVRFEYVNDGSEPLIITRIATSCTCMRADYRRRPLDVGERDVIELTYEPHKMEEGSFHKVVQVYSNSVDGMHLLTVSGNSVGQRR